MSKHLLVFVAPILAIVGSHAHAQTLKIDSAYVDGYAHTLHLYGDFGSVPGDILINNYKMPVLDWRSDSLAITIPASGDSASGEIIVQVGSQRGPSITLSRLLYTLSIGNYGRNVHEQYSFEEIQTLALQLCLGSTGIARSFTPSFDSDLFMAVAVKIGDSGYDYDGEFYGVYPPNSVNYMIAATVSHDTLVLNFPEAALHGPWFWIDSMTRLPATIKIALRDTPRVLYDRIAWSMTSAEEQRIVADCQYQSHFSDDFQATWEHFNPSFASVSTVPSASFNLWAAPLLANRYVKIHAASPEPVLGKLSIFNLLGEIVTARTVTIDPGDNIEYFTTSQWPSGTYIAELSLKNKVSTTRFIVEH